MRQVAPEKLLPPASGVDADQLATTLKELQQVQVQDLGLIALLSVHSS